jgi:hypothetical protein
MGSSSTFVPDGGDDDAGVRLLERYQSILTPCPTLRAGRRSCPGEQSDLSSLERRMRDDVEAALVVPIASVDAKVTGPRSHIA